MMLIVGTDASETLNGTEENDEILGMGGYDTLFGMVGDDLLNGGDLSDFLTGGEGADQFAFDMTTTVVTGGTFTFSGWLADNGLDPLEDGGTTQGEFSSSYTAWLNYLVASFGLGADLDGDGMVEVDLNQNSETGTPLIEGMSQEDLDLLFGERASLDVVTGKKTHERWFSDSFTIEDQTEVTSSAGTDVVTDFSREEGDTLVFAGLTAENFAAHMVVSEVDADADGVLDTVITAMDDPSFSVTLLGYAGFDVTLDAVFA
jgi:Ca2+-binding RTX toxin-like protein